MAAILIKKGYLSYEGCLYKAGTVLEVEGAEDIISRSGGRIVMAGQSEAVQAEVPKKPAKAKKPAEKPQEDGGEEGASLPEADPVAAVKK